MSPPAPATPVPAAAAKPAQVKEEPSAPSSRKSSAAGTAVTDSSKSADQLTHPSRKSVAKALVKLFVEQGANLRIRDDHGRIALHYASLNPHKGVDMMRLLLNSEQAEIMSFVDDNGQTPLHYAAKKDFIDGIQLMVDNGAFIDLPDQHEYSPYLWAVIAGQFRFSPQASRQPTSASLFLPIATCDQCPLSDRDTLSSARSGCVDRQFSTTLSDYSKLATCILKTASLTSRPIRPSSFTLHPRTQRRAFVACPAAWIRIRRPVDTSYIIPDENRVKPVLQREPWKRVTSTGLSVVPMKAYFQFLTTPTSDTNGTSLLLHFPQKRYIFGPSIPGSTERDRGYRYRIEVCSAYPRLESKGSNM